MRILVVDEQMALEVALIGQLRADAAAHGRPPGVVDFTDLAVDPILAEVPGAKERVNGCWSGRIRAWR